MSSSAPDFGESVRPALQLDAARPQLQTTFGEAARPQLEIVKWPFETTLPTVILEAEQWQRWGYETAKRALDVFVSVFAFIVGSPLFALIAVAIKVTSRGPILFCQERLGSSGTPFCCYKFRTMVVDAEEQLQRSAELRNAFKEKFKIPVDPRVTRLGALLRKLSLDELPQFWNVLKGDMTLIGPRPIVAEELEKYGSRATKLLSVTPGLSGLWQTCGRSDTSYDARVQLDMIYVDRHSFWLDLTLLVRTIVTVLRRAGAC